MKKSIRLILTGSFQPLFFNQYIKEQADARGIRGFVRGLPDGKAEVFIEGAMDSVNAFIPYCKQGPYNTQIRHVEEREERFQDFKDFKILKI